MALCKYFASSVIRSHLRSFDKAPTTRGLTTSGPKRLPLEVMVSQSDNLMANMALEEWIKRSSTHRQHKNLLLLSSNTLKQGKTIHALFYSEEGAHNMSGDQLVQQANLVFSSLPKDTAMTDLPVVHVGEEEGNLLISLPLDHLTDTDVNHTLQSIADTFIDQGPDFDLSRLSLVRPDGGWFPGIQDIQKDVEASFKEIEAMRQDKITSNRLK